MGSQATRTSSVASGPHTSKKIQTLGFQSKEDWFFRVLGGGGYLVKVLEAEMEEDWREESDDDEGWNEFEESFGGGF